MSDMLKLSVAQQGSRAKPEQNVPQKKLIFEPFLSTMRQENYGFASRYLSRNTMEQSC